MYIEVIGGTDSYVHCGHFAGGLGPRAVRCNRDATIAEIRKDDWSLCFPRCDEHGGKFVIYPDLWLMVPMKWAAWVQLRMGTIMVLDEQMSYELDSDEKWRALADAKRTVQQAILTRTGVDLRA